MRLIIVRHGQTKENVKNMVQGHMHGSLTKKGRDQIRTVGLKLRKEKIDIIFSSDLRRAIHTKDEIAKHHVVPSYDVKELRELDAGVFQGKDREVFFAARASSGLSRIEYRPKRGESYNDMKRRVRRFTNKIYKKYGNKTILIITHGGVIRCLLSIYLGVPLEQTLDMKTKNTGVLIIDVKKSGSEIVKDEMFKRKS